MRFLLDTHVFLWAQLAPTRISEATLLVAQSRYGWTLVTADDALHAYGVPVLSP